MYLILRRTSFLTISIADIIEENVRVWNRLACVFHPFILYNFVKHFYRTSYWTKILTERFAMSSLTVQHCWPARTSYYRVKNQKQNIHNGQKGYFDFMWHYSVCCSCTFLQSPQLQLPLLTWLHTQLVSQARGKAIRQVVFHSPSGVSTVKPIIFLHICKLFCCINHLFAKWDGIV